MARPRIAHVRWFLAAAEGLLPVGSYLAATSGGGTESLPPPDGNNERESRRSPDAASGMGLPDGERYLVRALPHVSAGFRYQQPRLRHSGVPPLPTREAKGSRKRFDVYSRVLPGNNQRVTAAMDRLSR